MATLKIKVLTNIRMKRSRKGEIYYGCSGLTTESQICYISAGTEDLKSHFQAENYIIIQKCNVSKRNSGIYVHLNKETMVSIDIFQLLTILQTVSCKFIF